MVVEERLEDARQDLGRHPRPGVLDRDDDRALRRVVAGNYADLVLVCVPLGDRLRRVHQQVHEDLAEPQVIRHHRGHTLEVPQHARAVPDRVVGHLDRALEHGDDVRRLRAVVVAPREGLQPANDPAHSIGPLARVVDVPQEIGRAARHEAGIQEAGSHEIEASEDVGERVVHLVGDGRRERSHGREAFGLHESGLRLHPFGDVDAQADRTVELTRGATDGRKGRLEHDLPHPGDDAELLAGEHPAGVGNQRRVVRVEVEDRAPHELFGTKPELLEAAPLRQRHDPLPVEGEENDGSVRQEVLQPSLGEVGARPGPDLLGDVREGDDDVRDAPGLVEERPGEGAHEHSLAVAAVDDDVVDRDARLLAQCPRGRELVFRIKVSAERVDAVRRRVGADARFGARGHPEDLLEGFVRVDESPVGCAHHEDADRQTIGDSRDELELQG